MQPPAFDRELDTSGLQCPMPLVKARQEMAQVNVGQVLKVLSTDRGSVQDFQHWAKAAKNVDLVYQDTSEVGGKPTYIHYLKRMS